MKSLKLYQATIYQINEALKAAERAQELPLIMALGIAKKGLESSLEANSAGASEEISVQ